MLIVVDALEHPYVQLVKDDPVRPEIQAEFRVGNNREILVLEREGAPAAVVCVSYQDAIPQATSQLIPSEREPQTAIFYTIWSYVAGAGRELIRTAQEYIQANKPSVKRFVTLSPKTEMARKFHLKNGAQILQENDESVNYEYTAS